LYGNSEGERMERKKITSILQLVLVTVFWGIGFPAMKIVSGSVTPFYQVGIRFFIATVVLIILFHSRLRYINRKLIKDGLILSGILFCTYIFATIGIGYTTSSRASFFCCLAVIIVPFLLWLVCKNKIKIKSVISAIICTIGLFVISYTSDMGISFNLGDILCLMCSVCSATHLITTEKFIKDNDPALLTLIQMAFISILGLMVALCIEDFPVEIKETSLYALLFIGIFGTALGFFMQTNAQQYIDSTRVGIIFSLEPVNGVIASYILLGDSMGARSIIGGILIFVALIHSEIDIKSFVKKLKNEQQGDEGLIIEREEISNLEEE